LEDIFDARADPDGGPRGFFNRVEKFAMSGESVVTLSLPEGGQMEIPSGSSVLEVAERISPGLARKALAARVNGKEVDLTYKLEEDNELKILTSDDPEALEIFRHSSAHLLAAAVMELFPGTECGIGPPIEDGFFYDFRVERPFTPEDLEKIEKRMKELAKENIPYKRVEIPKEEALEIFRKQGQELKVELVAEKGGEVVSCYQLGEFFDFCHGPHVPSTGRIKPARGKEAIAG
jgi:threonyl-tRNA synthetase